MRRRLTEVVLRTLKTNKAQEDVFHDGTPSAGIRLTKDGRKTFFALYRSPKVLDRHGQPKLRRIYFGEHGTGKAGEPRYLTLEEFRIAYQVFRGDLAKGIDPQEGHGAGEAVREAERNIPASALPEWLRSVFKDGYVVGGSLAHLLALYFEAARIGTVIKPLAPRTLKGYVTAAKTHILPQHGKKPAVSFNSDNTSDILTTVLKTSPQMVRQVKKVISGAFQYGRQNVRELKNFPNPTREFKSWYPKAGVTAGSRTEN